MHDRGNSLFLGKSFGNLPSPVQEDATIKRLFKFNEDEKDVPQRGKNETRNQQIRIEGKDKPAPDLKKESQNKDFNVDINELNRFVFNDLDTSNAAVDDAYALNTSVARVNQSYQEEESYENPQNVSRVAYNPGTAGSIARVDNLPDIQSECTSQNVMDNLLGEMQLREKFESDTVKIQMSTMLKDVEFCEESFEVLENTSRKNTQKMTTNRREFSFFDSQKHQKQKSKQTSGAWDKSDTMTRL